MAHASVMPHLIRQPALSCRSVDAGFRREARVTMEEEGGRPDDWSYSMILVIRVQAGGGKLVSSAGPFAPAPSSAPLRRVEAGVFYIRT